MQRRALSIILGLLPLLTRGQTDCIVPGICKNSTEIGISFPTDSNKCLADCQAQPTCYYFSYEFVDDLCIMYAGCTVLDADVNKESVSGNRNCDFLECRRVGNCDGSLVSSVGVTNEDECMLHCASNIDCDWWSFNAESSPVCHLYSSCDSVLDDCNECTYGQRECGDGAYGTTIDESTPSSGPQRKTLVLFGDDRQVDVVSLEGKSCDPMPDLPKSASDTYTFSTNSGVTPNVCSWDDCYEFDGSAWITMPNPSQNKRDGAGAQIDDYTFWAIGGYYSSTTGETYSDINGTWSRGPDPPRSLYDHCAAVYQNNFVYMNGGYDPLSSPHDTYVYDWTTGTYTKLADSPHSHDSGVCGIVETANGPEFVAAGYGSYVDIYNINDGTWRESNADYVAYRGPAYVQFEDTFLYMGGSNKLNIYQWEPSLEAFISRPEQLPRILGKDTDPSAVLIDGTILNCQ